MSDTLGSPSLDERRDQEVRWLRVRELDDHVRRACDLVPEYDDAYPVLRELLAALQEAAEQGRGDDEIVGRVRRVLAEHPSGERLELAALAYVMALRGEMPVQRRPSAYAAAKIARVPAVAARLRRDSRRGVTKAALAAAIEVSQDTLYDWIKRGWMNWPPD